MGDQLSGGVSVGRERNIDQQQNNYLGEVGHGPLDEFVKQLAQRYRQQQAQRDLGYGGSGYGLAAPGPAGQTGRPPVRPPSGPDPRPRNPNPPAGGTPTGTPTGTGGSPERPGRTPFEPVDQPNQNLPMEGGGVGGDNGDVYEPDNGVPPHYRNPTGGAAGTGDLVDYFGPNGYGNEYGAQTPDGGLFGTYGRLANYQPTDEERWVGGRYLDQTGDPRTQLDRDVEGGFRWQASGERTDDENALNWRYRNIANDPNSALDREVVDNARTFVQNPGATGIDGVSDRDIYDAYGNVTRTAGRGEDEAYGAYKGMLDRPGYSDATKSAMVTQGMLSARAAGDSALDEMKNRRNVGGGSEAFFGAAARLGRGQAGVMGQQARQNEIDFANEAARQTEVGAGGMTDLASIGNQRRQFGISGQAGLQDSARRARMYGNDMLANRSDTEFGRRMEGIGGMERATRNARDDQRFGLTGSAGRADEMSRRTNDALAGYRSYSDQMEARRREGREGQRGLYEGSREDENNLVTQIMSGLRTPRETYSFDRSTTGSGGVSI